tara:strand:+ start:105330 stop:105698 length:369 start_codon:yes stop_codon:yes gene_type:complete
MMKPIQFNASEVSLQLEQGYHVLAFYNDDEYLFLQRLEEIGHKEDDGVYIEYKDPIHAGFDVAASVSLSKKQFTLTLKSPLYKLPDVLSFDITLQLSDEDYGRYGTMLEIFFSDRQVEVAVR